MQVLRVPGFLALVGLLAACGAPVGSVSPTRATSPAHARAIPAGYYAHAEGKTGRALLQAVHDRSYNHTDLGYDHARDLMFGEVDDPDQDNVVIGVYTGKLGENVTDRRSAGEQSMNAEHTWPQSLGAEGAAKADLHHLYPSDMDTNSKRGSLPMGIVTQIQWTGPDQSGRGDVSVLGLNAEGVKVWQPRPQERGNVARALLYFYATYGVSPSSVRPSLKNFTVELPVLLQWHAQDPVDEYERVRNDGVFKVQGNRNPFVDHPEYVGAIGSFTERR